MRHSVGGCKAAASVLGVKSVGCNECPFPFCVVAEAEIVKIELRIGTAKIMRELGHTIEETAKAMGVSLRSVCRYSITEKDGDCKQCNLIHSKCTMCRCDIYSVTCEDGRYAIILNRHRRATKEELSVVEHFIDYAFPFSAVQRSADRHDYWALSNVELKEAQGFQCMCDALSMYTLNLDRGVTCQQQVT